MIEVGRHVARIGKCKSDFKILTGKIRLERHRRRWEENISSDLKEAGTNIKIWMIRLSIRNWRALVNSALNPGVS